jgi:hypothetical protein
MWMDWRRRWHPMLPKRIDELTPINGQVWQDFMSDPRQRVDARCRSHIAVQGGDDFAEGLGDVELNVPHLLVRPRRQMPFGLIEALNIPPGLSLQ